MRVKNRMTHDPITASLKTNYNQALRLMQQNDIKSLPILDGTELIGIVTRSDMLRAEPSPVTTLSVFEIASLLEKVTMEKIMSKPVLAIDEMCSITNAAQYMLQNDVGCLPVVKDGSILVGIITDTDIFKAFIDVTGGGQTGSRIEARILDQKGQLAPFINAFTKADSNIVSVSITYEQDGEHAIVDLKERGGDETTIRNELDRLGVEILEFRPSDDDDCLSFG